MENRMIITEEYRQLMEYSGLPERFQAGAFGLFDFEEKILREFVDHFYEAAEKNGTVALGDFEEFMAFLWTLSPAESDQVQNLPAYAYSRCFRTQNSRRKQKLPEITRP